MTCIPTVRDLHTRQHAFIQPRKTNQADIIHERMIRLRSFTWIPHLSNHNHFFQNPLRHDATLTPKIARHKRAPETHPAPGHQHAGVLWRLQIGQAAAEPLRCVGAHGVETQIWDQELGGASGVASFLGGTGGPKLSVSELGVEDVTYYVTCSWVIFSNFWTYKCICDTICDYVYI